MKNLNRARRVGITAIGCSVLLRLFAAGIPEELYFRLIQPNIDAVLMKLETGQNVRFSSYSESFSPDFMESPPPYLPQTTEPSLPVFSGNEKVDLYYAVRKQPDIEALLEKPLQWNLFGAEPSVLILHTHTTESYTKQGESYKETSSWRTLDEDYNMLSIGHLVENILEENGIAVVQDRTVHDHPSYSGSYIRARQSIRDILDEYKNIRLVLDLHRDAAGTENNQMRTKAVVNGKTSAQLMVVIGTNHEGYEENLSLGLKLHIQLEKQAAGIMRPLQLRSQRFNQDLSSGALLIEIGAAGNSHREAWIAAEELAKAVVALAGGTASE